MSVIGALVVCVAAVFAIGYLWQYLEDQWNGIRSGLRNRRQ